MSASGVSLSERPSARSMAVAMISSEMPEVLGMSDSIMVMHEGRVTGFLNRDEATQIKVMELAAMVFLRGLRPPFRFH
ncbi:hypothetical protein ACC720_39465, partial [Rhizobium ruizarguesonis]